MISGCCSTHGALCTLHTLGLSGLLHFGRQLPSSRHRTDSRVLDQHLTNKWVLVFQPASWNTKPFQTDSHCLRLSVYLYNTALRANPYWTCLDHQTTLHATSRLLNTPIPTSLMLSGSPSRIVQCQWLHSSPHEGRQDWWMDDRQLAELHLGVCAPSVVCGCMRACNACACCMRMCEHQACVHFDCVACVQLQASQQARPRCIRCMHACNALANEIMQ